MNTSFDSPPASNTRSKTAHYPVAKPELNSSQTSTTHHETAATTRFQGRSVLPSQTVSKEQLMKLILSDGLSKDISYEVHDYVEISNCPGLTVLSGNISALRAMFICDCPELETISANLFVDGSLFIRACPRLKSINGSVTVKSDFIAPGMPALVDLPGTFSIGNRLHLSACSHLQDLSGNFSVQGSANVSHCQRLSDLSGKFIVGNTLDLSCCPHLTNLSGNFSVGRHIILNHCTRLKAVPNWMITLSSRKSRDLFTADLEYSGLSKAVTAQLHAAQTPGVRFDTTDEKTRLPHKIFNNLPEALAYWWNLAGSQKEAPQLNLQPEQAEDMLAFLEQLTWTDEYLDENYQPVLAQRVLQAITLLLMDDRLREEALFHISEGTTSFDEVVSDSLEPLEDMLQDNRLQSYSEYRNKQLSTNSARMAKHVS